MKISHLIVFTVAALLAPSAVRGSSNLRGQEKWGLSSFTGAASSLMQKVQNENPVAAVMLEAGNQLNALQNTLGGFGGKTGDQAIAFVKNNLGNLAEAGTQASLLQKANKGRKNKNSLKGFSFGNALGNVYNAMAATAKNFGTEVMGVVEARGNELATDVEEELKKVGGRLMGNVVEATAGAGGTGASGR